jgi:hypothetical protein
MITSIHATLNLSAVLCHHCHLPYVRTSQNQQHLHLPTLVQLNHRYIHVCGATGLSDAVEAEPPNCQCMVSFDGCERVTGIVEKSTDPSWNQVMIISLGIRS